MTAHHTNHQNINTNASPLRAILYTIKLHEGSVFCTCLHFTITFLNICSAGKSINDIICLF